MGKGRRERGTEGRSQKQTEEREERGEGERGKQSETDRGEERGRCGLSGRSSFLKCLMACNPMVIIGLLCMLLYIIIGLLFTLYGQ